MVNGSKKKKKKNVWFQLKIRQGKCCFDGCFVVNY